MDVRSYWVQKKLRACPVIKSHINGESSSTCVIKEKLQKKEKKGALGHIVHNDQIFL